MTMALPRRRPERVAGTPARIVDPVEPIPQRGFTVLEKEWEWIERHIRAFAGRDGVWSHGVSAFFSAAASFGAGLAGLIAAEGVPTLVLTVFWVLTFASLVGGVVSLTGQRSRRQQGDREVDEILGFMMLVESNYDTIEF